jgi:hypothetical protein
MRVDVQIIQAGELSNPLDNLLYAPLLQLGASLRTKYVVSGFMRLAALKLPQCAYLAAAQPMITSATIL